MTPKQRQEEISKAYLHAVAARCGFTVASWTQDHGGIDATVGAASTVGAGTISRPKVDIQLKATTQQDLVRDDFVSWTLEIAHYDSLRAAASIPHLLVVLVLPENADDGIEHTAEQLVIRRCAYWVKMTGMDEADRTSTKTVRLPRSNVFSPDALREILGKISRNEAHAI